MIYTFRKMLFFFPFFLYKYIREIISDRGKVGYTLCIQILRKKSIDVPHRLQFKVDIFEKILNYKDQPAALLRRQSDRQSTS
jgi:hypothetical protein